MQLNYDNIIFIHRYDMNIPIEETCKQWIIENGINRTFKRYKFLIYFF